MRNQELANQNKKLAFSVSVKSIIVNVLLSGFKLFAGIFANSAAMVSDAIHSASDVFSTFVVMVGISLSSKEEDKDHPYGHERLECVAAILLAVILCITGVGIGIDGAKKIALGVQGNLQAPGMLALIAAASSIAVKEWMYWFTRAAAKKINSGALMADAWHHRSDAFSSVGSLVGIVGAMMGFPIADPIACIVICAFIVKASVDIFRDAINKMTDAACDEETEKAVAQLVQGVDGVLALDMIKTRLFGARMYVEIEISARGDLTLWQAHQIAETVHDAIEEKFMDVKHCTVHVNPAQIKQPSVTEDAEPTETTKKP